MFSVVKGAGWYDTILFTAPGSPAVQAVAGALVAGSSTVTGLLASAVVALVPGQVVTSVGVPAGTTIASVPSSTSIVLSAPATVTMRRQPHRPTDTAGSTGISFELQVRPTSSSPVLSLDVSTAAGTIINGGAVGQINFNVPPAAFANIPAGTYSADLVAKGDGITLNLFQTNGAASSLCARGDAMSITLVLANSGANVAGLGGVATIAPGSLYPAGAQGAVGAQGPIGPTGPQGGQGSTGPQGANRRNRGNRPAALDYASRRMDRFDRLYRDTARFVGHLQRRELRLLDLAHIDLDLRCQQVDEDRGQGRGRQPGGRRGSLYRAEPDHRAAGSGPG